MGLDAGDMMKGLHTVGIKKAEYTVGWIKGILYVQAVRKDEISAEDALIEIKKAVEEYEKAVEADERQRSN